MEIGAGQAEQVSQIVRDSGLTLVTVLEDLNRIPRCVVAQKDRERADG
jgi:methylase of polypeptide subunit release factors